MSWWDWLWETEAYRDVCLRDAGGLTWGYVLADGMLAVSYFLIPGGLVWLWWHRRQAPRAYLTLYFAAFIFLCGCTHLFKVVSVWWPALNLGLVVNYAAGLMSMATAGALLIVLPELKRIRTTDEAMRGIEQGEHVRRILESAKAIRRQIGGRHEP